MEALSRSNPILMIFEDVHWIDPTSLEVLGRSVERLKPLRVLLQRLITARIQPAVDRTTGYVTALSLNRRREHQQMAASRLAD